MRINKIIGIYCIENLINNKKYIGKGLDIIDGGEGSLGWIPSQETKENIRKALFGKNLSEERKLRMKVPKKRSSNIKYKSIYRGVSFKNEKYWRASLKLNNKSIHIGIYDTEIDAAKAYDEYIINNNLPHPLNFPEDYPNRGAINNDS